MTLEKRIWALGTLFSILLVLLSTRIVYWQLVRGNDLQGALLDPLAVASKDPDELRKGPQGIQDVVELLSRNASGVGLESLPQPVVQRTVDLMEDITRGVVSDRNGRLLAYDWRDVEGDLHRIYTEPSLAHVLGYTSGIRVGISGLELNYNDSLLGLDRPDTQLDLLIHQPIVGSELRLTLDSGLQRAADEALAGQAGAIVVLDGRSGAVLAMASAPRFDPNRILEESYLTGLLDQPGVFLNRASQSLYTPGSTWKTVTLIAALDSGQVEIDTMFDFGKPVNGPNGSYYVYEVDGGVIPDPNHKESKLDLTMSYAKSANAAFARIGAEMNPDVFIDYAARFGFSAPEDGQFLIEIPFIPSQLASHVEDLRSNNLLRAATAIGQGELLVNPLNMAFVTLSVLNEGNLPIPFFVESITTPLGGTDARLPNRRTVQNLMKAETAHQVHQMMVAVVERGSAGAARVSGTTVGGKTGTAQMGGNQAPHAWFMGFAEEGDRSVAIVVMIENAGQGSQVAAPIFSRMADYALRRLGESVEEVVPDLPPPAREPWTEQTAQTESAENPESIPEEGAPEGLEPTAEAQPAPTEPDPPVTLRPPDISKGEARVGLGLRGPGSCREVEADASQGLGVFNWPSDFHDIAPGGDGFKPRHPGIDLAAPEGSPVYASDAGAIVFAGWTESGYGNTVIIDHRNGYRSLYGHLSQVMIPCGTNVEAGQLIGLAGESGDTYGDHLHFEIRTDEGFIDPMALLPAP